MQNLIQFVRSSRLVTTAFGLLMLIVIAAAVADPDPVDSAAETRTFAADPGRLSRFHLPGYREHRHPLGKHGR